jgi:hypothetical protein
MGIVKRWLGTGLIVYSPLIMRGQQGQVSPEWRPRIAEDNKAATWDDTSRFLVNAITNNGKNYIVVNPPSSEDAPPAGRRRKSAPVTWRIGVEYEYDVVSPSNCLLTEKTFAYQDSKSELIVLHINLASVDPLSVKVRFDSDYAAFVVHVSGTSQQEVGQVMLVDRVGAIPASDLYPSVNVGLLQDDCRPDDGACKVERKPAFDNQERFVDEEMAHRVARAFMHAALLCGGTKAVSPF